MEGNLFAHLPCLGEAEQFVELLSRPGLRVERIVSRAHASPPDFWYEQPYSEWVLVVAGRAGLRFEDEGQVRILGRGDFVDIVPHRRHRVEWTDASEPTIWLAVHYGDGSGIEMEPHDCRAVRKGCTEHQVDGRGAIGHATTQSGM